MTRQALLWCALALLLPACAPRLSPIPYPSVPHDPLARSLDDQRRSFQNLKALARVETARQGKRRVYESVAIVQRGFDRLRIEGYGPLGETVFALLWDGSNVLLLPPDGSGARTIGPAGFERLLGVGLSPGDLCSVLVGGAPHATVTAAGCSTDGRCALDAEEGKARWRILLQPRPSGQVVIDSIERYQGANIAFQVRYERTDGTGPYALPRRIIVQDPAHQASLLVDYLDTEVNGTVEESAFQLSAPAGAVQ